MSNKAHSTVINRLVARYQGTPTEQAPFDVIAGELRIAVESTATLQVNLPQLLLEANLNEADLTKADQIYVAATNQDTLTDAFRLTAGTRIGVMNSRGDILKPAGGAASSTS